MVPDGDMAPDVYSARVAGENHARHRHALRRSQALPAARRRGAAAPRAPRRRHARGPARRARGGARRRADGRGGRRAGGARREAARRRGGHVAQSHGGRMNGYWNKILHVSLGDRRTWIEEPGEAFFRRLGGGRGVIAHYLLRHVPKGADPLGPDNVLVFAPGVLTGAPVPGAGRHSVGARSPLTGAFGEAGSGGYGGAERKRAGWAALVVHGAASAPVYLWINDGAVELRDATPLWGKPTGEAEEAILAELGDPRVRVAQIGPAGRGPRRVRVAQPAPAGGRLVLFACIVNDPNECAGRTGMGAVMGSKKL